MKKLVLLMAILGFILSACDMPGSAPEPTAVALPTAIPTAVIVTNPTEAPEEGKAGDERASSIDGMVQVYIPGGSFQMGGLDTDAQDDEKPAHKVTLGAYWMDKIEVTNAMYALCVQAGVCELPREFKSATREKYFNNADFNDYPVVYVNWLDAKTYCEWAGRRLPTEAEWEFAARGSDFRRYPWGDDSPTNNLANYDYSFRDTTRVGSIPGGASPFGILDMAGNVWEWVSDFYEPNFYAGASEANPLGPATAGVNGPRKVIRGGSWADNFKDLRVSNRGYAMAPDRTADSKSDQYKGEAKETIGFRCVSGK